MDKYFKFLDDKFKDEQTINHGVKLNNDDLEELYVLTEKLNQDIENQKIAFAEDKKGIVGKQRAKLIYLAKLCNDAKQPLMQVNYIIELLKGTALTDNQLKYLNILKSSVEDIDNKIEQATDYSKVETGGFMQEFIDFNLTSLLNNTYDYYKLKALRNDIRLNFVMEERLWPSYRSDPNRIGQILNEMLNNAIGFTDNGEIDFIVEQAQHFGTMSEIKFIIRDTGNGLKMDKMSKLFQQVKLKYSNIIANSEKQMEKSNFNIISKIAQYMGGELKIESSGYQGGVQFVLTIPLEISNN